MSAHQIDIKCEDIQIHLAARCAGLLEITTAHSRGEIRQDCPIRYMHRTARDFLEQNEQWIKVLSYTDSQAFCPSFSMMKSCTLSLIMDNFRYPEYMVDHPAKKAKECMASDVLIYARHADDHSPTRHSRTQLLRALASVKSLFTSEPPVVIDHFLQRATLFSLTGYVEDVLSVQDRAIASQTAGILLDYLFRGPRLLWPGIPYPTAKMAKCLFGLGAVPRNTSPAYVGLGPWSAVITWIPKIFESPPEILPQLLDTYISVIKEFLKAGVDPTISVLYKPRHTIFLRTGEIKTIVIEYVEPHFPDKAADLLERIDYALRRQNRDQRIYEEQLVKKRTYSDIADHPPKLGYLSAVACQEEVRDGTQAKKRREDTSS